MPSPVATWTGWDQGLLGGECGGLWVYSVEPWASPSPGSREKAPCVLLCRAAEVGSSPLESGRLGPAPEVSKEPSLHGKSIKGLFPNWTSRRGACSAGSQPEGAFPIFEGWEEVMQGGPWALAQAVRSHGQETSERGCSCNRKWVGGALPPHT